MSNSQPDTPVSSNLVAVLRELAGAIETGHFDVTMTDEPEIRRIRKAADEIERLRAALENIRDGIGLEAMSALSLTDARAIARMALSGDSSAHETSSVLSSETKLRRLVAFLYGQHNLYLDDGELQDNSAQPFIDFLRDSPDEIAHKIQTRGLASLRSPVEPTPVPASTADQASTQRVGSAVAGGGSEKASVPRGKPCTCDNCLGSSTSCRVEAGERLGELWYCQKAANKNSSAPPVIAHGADGDTAIEAK